MQHTTQRVPFVEPAVYFSIDHTCHAWLQPCCPLASALCSSLENLPTFYALLLTAGVRVLGRPASRPHLTAL